MATLPTYSKDGKKSGTLTVPKTLVESKPHHILLHQAAVTLLSNRRRPIAHTKTRGEVSGGGRKPWRQKGTGRARHGSIRSPLWRGGGVVFGPRNVRNYQKRLPTAMGRQAFRQVLAEKIRRGEVIVVIAFEPAKPKTHLIEAILDKLPVKEGQILVVTNEATPDLVRATNNLPYLSLRTPLSVNTLDLLTADSVVITKQAFAELEKRYV